jgi:hypothetical protein
LNELEKNDPQTLELLRDFTMLNPKWIPEKLFDDIDANKLNKSLDKLEAYWIINRDIQKKVFTISKEIQLKIMEFIDW